MPFYEYISVDLEKSCEHCYNIFEVKQSINDARIEKCPICCNAVRRIIGSGGFIVGGKEMNQYSDVRYSKYWRDSNGVRHKVTNQDGHPHSLTISNKKTATTEEMKFREKSNDIKSKKQRNVESYDRFKKLIKKK